MPNPNDPELQVDVDPEETTEWLDSIEDVLRRHGPERVNYLLSLLEDKARRSGVTVPIQVNTPYINTIATPDEPRFPGSREIERRIKSIVRWNAMAMVVRANRGSAGIGGHISTYASAATLYEIGFNHFFQGAGLGHSGDQIYFQGHASPGIYARAFLEGRLSAEELENFRREVDGKGLSSYPHPWLMPNFWYYPSVSMGLSPIMAIYQARFNRYLEDRGLCDTSQSRVWCFIGDGETDEPETLGALTLAAREELDNLIFVCNCNLQRLDGPVRGNHKIIQELESAFRGAGWDVIKVVWGSDWDPLLARDSTGELVRRMGEVVDGEYQRYTTQSGAETREDFFGTSPTLLQLAEQLSDEEIRRMRRGGHDPEKVYAAYRAAVDRKNGRPTVILAKTVKGYGLGEAGEGRNVTHSQKKLNEQELREFRSRFGIPISDEEIADAPFYVPPEDGPEMRYLRERREALGGAVPARTVRAEPLVAPSLEDFAEYFQGSGERELSTTMAFVRMFGKLLKHPEIGKLIVPIIPDEARTFGMEALFRQVGIYSHCGQRYEPVDSDTLLFYKEAVDGQILEEGINEAGAMASWIAAGTAYSSHGVNTIPFFIYYSMFGFQRIGDLIWAAADCRTKGFLLGGTAGRTTLNGEGLQHQDGHSHLLAATVPNLVAYDPAYGYETAVIVQDGIRRMYQDQENIFYYITLCNENYVHPELPEDAREGILRGMYRVKSRDAEKSVARIQLFGSGPILREALRAQEILADRYHVSSDVWSVTSYKELRRDALEAQRWNLLHPDETPRSCYLWDTLKGVEGPFVAVSDYMRLVSEQIAPWVPGEYRVLGTDGFGRSDTRKKLRRHFEIDAETVVLASLDALRAEGKVGAEVPAAVLRDLEIDPEKTNPLTA